MDFTTVWDRATDTSLNGWLFAKLQSEKQLFALAKDRTDTSLERPKFRELVLDTLTHYDNFVRVYEHSEKINDYWFCLAEYDYYAININYYGRTIYVEVIAKNLDSAEQICEKVITFIPLPEPPKPNHVDFDFFMLGQDGRTNKIHRSLLAPEWSDIAKNYQKDTRTQLNNLVNLNPENIGDGGKLILLHGEPGLGKSYAIRALMRSMMEWSYPSYLMDPEKFFAIPPYMFDIILSESTYGQDPEKWRLIIAEDSDEFIRADAKDRSGQGLSRLLNLADGILGQGMKVIFLLTTNEPLTNLHPAVIRPGRCIANIEFKPFNLTEATEWLKGEWPNNLKPKNNYSLAELFDAKKNQQQIRVEKEFVTTGQYL